MIGHPDNPISELQMGKAGEYIVCADLILQGYVAYPSEQGLPYDVVADTPRGLVKIQVKTARRPKTCRGRYPPLYVYSSMKRGKNGKGTYKETDVDIFAFVGIEDCAVAYLKLAQCKTCLQFRSEAYRGSYYSEQRSSRVRGRYLRDCTFASAIS